MLFQEIEFTRPIRSERDAWEALADKAATQREEQRQAAVIASLLAGSSLELEPMGSEVIDYR